jgi:hypothetical protein
MPATGASRRTRRLRLPSSQGHRPRGTGRVSPRRSGRQPSLGHSGRPLRHSIGKKRRPYRRHRPDRPCRNGPLHGHSGMPLRPCRRHRPCRSGRLPRRSGRPRRPDRLARSSGHPRRLYRSDQLAPIIGRVRRLLRSGPLARRNTGKKRRPYRPCRRHRRPRSAKPRRPRRPRRLCDSGPLPRSSGRARRRCRSGRSVRSSGRARRRHHQCRSGRLFRRSSGRPLGRRHSRSGKPHPPPRRHSRSGKPRRPPRPRRSGRLCRQRHSSRGHRYLRYSSRKLIRLARDQAPESGREPQLTLRKRSPTCRRGGSAGSSRQPRA